MSGQGRAGPKPPIASVLLTTYNNPRALQLVLTGLALQRVEGFEVWVADDGSTDATREVVDRFAAGAPWPLEHVWQEDDGFRKMRILNLSLPRVRSDYVVLLDGDCIPHRDYVASHLRYRGPRRFLYGHRVFLGPRTSASLTPDRLRQGELGGLARNLVRQARGDAHRAYNALRLSGAPLVGLAQAAQRGRRPVMRGMNFSAWKEDLLAINGWNEDYGGWGREDDDLVARLLFRGLEGRSVRFAAILYHLDHPVQSRASLEGNDRILEDVLRRRDPVCRNGIRKVAPCDGVSRLG